MNAKQRAITLAGLSLALVLPGVGLTRYLPDIPGMNPMYLRELFWWLLLALLVFFVVLIEMRPLRSIGVKRPNWKTFAVGIATGVVAVVGITTIYFAVFPRLGLHMNTGEMSKLLQTPYWYRFLLVTRAAMVEETLFRGYGIQRLEELTSSHWIAGVVTWTAFTLAHLSSWGWAQLSIAGWGGAILTALYLWRRDLVCNVVAHWVTDGAGFLLPR